LRLANGGQPLGEVNYFVGSLGNQQPLVLGARREFLLLDFFHPVVKRDKLIDGNGAAMPPVAGDDLGGEVVRYSVIGSDAEDCHSLTAHAGISDAQQQSWRSSTSACWSVLGKCLTPPTDANKTLPADLRKLVLDMRKEFFPGTVKKAKTPKAKTWSSFIKRMNATTDV